jgi:predicted type IV restriction endonuclease
VRLIRTKQRVYEFDPERTAWSRKDGAHIPVRSVKAHAEYAVVEGANIFARIVFNRGAWIVVERSDEKSFGKPVSPLNLKLLRDVKEWAIERYATTVTSDNCEIPGWKALERSRRNKSGFERK